MTLCFLAQRNIHPVLSFFLHVPIVEPTKNANIPCYCAPAIRRHSSFTSVSLVSSSPDNHFQRNSVCKVLNIKRLCREQQKRLRSYRSLLLYISCGYSLSNFTIHWMQSQDIRSCHHQQRELYRSRNLLRRKLATRPLYQYLQAHQSDRRGLG
jgi:hypothetical protein